jgi:hypothetical protein
MPKIPSIRAREVVRVAEATGFVFDRRRGSHAVYYRKSDHRRWSSQCTAAKTSNPAPCAGSSLTLACRWMVLGQFEIWWGRHSCLPRGDVLIDPNRPLRTARDGRQESTFCAIAVSPRASAHYVILSGTPRRI